MSLFGQHHVIVSDDIVRYGLMPIPGLNKNVPLFAFGVGTTCLSAVEKWLLKNLDEIERERSIVTTISPTNS